MCISIYAHRQPRLRREIHTRISLTSPGQSHWRLAPALDPRIDPCMGAPVTTLLPAGSCIVLTASALKRPQGWTRRHACEACVVLFVPACASVIDISLTTLGALWVLRALHGCTGSDCTGALTRVMGVFLICLLFSRCCPPRLLYPCNTQPLKVH